MNRPAKVTQGEIARAIRAARQAGGDDLCVEIAPDGTIRIVPIDRRAQNIQGTAAARPSIKKEIVL